MSLFIIQELTKTSKISHPALFKHFKNNLCKKERDPHLHHIAHTQTLRLLLLLHTRRSHRRRRRR